MSVKLTKEDKKYLSWVIEQHQKNTGDFINISSVIENELGEIISYMFFESRDENKRKILFNSIK